MDSNSDMTWHAVLNELLSGNYSVLDTVRDNKVNDGCEDAVYETASNARHLAGYYGTRDSNKIFAVVEQWEATQHE